MLGGVAGGIAKSYGWDPTLVRLAFVVASIFGIGIPVYVVAWIVIPPEPDDGTEAQPRETGPLLGLILLGVGILWLGGRLVPDGDVAGIIWPLTLIGGGIAVLVMRGNQVEDPAPEGPGSAPPSAATAAFATGATTATATAAPAGARPAEETTSAWPSEPWGWPRPPAPPRLPRVPRPRRVRTKPRPFLGPLTFSIVCVSIGVGALLASLDTTRVDPEVVVSLALAVTGAALVVSAWFGRARGLVALAIVLTLACSVLAVIDTPFRGGIGDRDYTPQSVTELRDDYRLAIGSMTVDLRGVTFPLGTTDVESSVAVGDLSVIVPDDVTVDAHGEVGMGQVELFGARDGGISVEQSTTARAGTGRRVLHLDMRTGIGRVRVVHVSELPVGGLR
jgi:phage shock protein PspC (stress-responsive transcriptional regulator)